MTLSPSATVLHIFEAPYVRANLTFLNSIHPILGENVTRAALDNIVFHLGS